MVAGLALGAGLFLPGTRVHGMMVDSEPFDRITADLVRETAALLEADAAEGTAAVEIDWEALAEVLDGKNVG